SVSSRRMLGAMTHLLALSIVPQIPVPVDIPYTRPLLDQPVEQAGDKQRQGTRHAGALFRFPLEFEQEYFGSAMSFDGAAEGSESKPLTLHVVVEAQVRLVGAGVAQMVSGPGKQGVVAAQQKLSATSEPCNLRLLPHKLCKGGCHV